MRENNIDPEPDELGDDLGVALVASLSPANLYRDIATLVPTELAQPLLKSGGHLALGGGRARAQEPDGRELPRLLRPRRERPRRRRGTEEGDELASSRHSITSSARTSTVAGTSRPSALAVFMFSTVSYLVGACTGR